MVPKPDDDYDYLFKGAAVPGCALVGGVLFKGAVLLRGALRSPLPAACR